MHLSTSYRSMPGWLYLMGALTALGPFSIDMYLPAFPTIAASLDVTRGEVERTLAIYLIGLALAQIFYGPMADRYGRRPPLMLGLVLYIVASLGCALAPTIESLTFWRFIQAVGGAAGIVVPRAVIRDHYDTQQSARALSMLMLIMGLAPILAPLAGGQLLVLGGWRSLFWLMLVIAIALLACVVFIMRESLHPERVVPLRMSAILSNYGALLKHRRFMFHSLAGGFGQAGMFAYIIGSPRIFIEIYGIDPQHYGFLFGTTAFALIAGSQVSARMLRTRTPAALQGGAQKVLLAAALVALLIAVAGYMTLPLLMVCLVGYMASQGFVSPSSAALALSQQGNRLGVASALLGTLQLTSGAFAGLIMSTWQAQSALPLTTVLASCAALSWLAGRMARRES